MDFRVTTCGDWSRMRISDFMDTGDVFRWLPLPISSSFLLRSEQSSDPSSECFFGAFWFEARQFRRQGPRAASPWWDFTRDHDPEVVRNRWPWPTHRAAETHTPRKLKASSSTSDCESTNLKEEFGWTPLAFPPWHKALFCHFNLTLILFVYYSAVGHPWTFLFSIMFSIVREMVQICPNWSCCLATVSCIHFVDSLVASGSWIRAFAQWDWGVT